MTPILFDGSARSFITNGLGRLTDAISCTITEERNGLYELEMTYPVTGSLYKELGLDKIIVANNNGSRQAFDIYKITEPINNIVTINANHLSYRLNYIPVSPFSATGITETLNKLSENCLEDNPFSLSTDIENEETIYNQTEPKSFRACLGGSKDSILDLFSGAGACEYLWDNWNIKILSHRGDDKQSTLTYSVNITDFNKEKTNEDVYTGAIAYWLSKDENGDILMSFYGDPQYSEYVDKYPNKRTVLLDISSEMDVPPTKTQLNNMAKDYVKASGLPKENIKISFIDLRNFEEYKDVHGVLDINLCDVVTVKYKPYNIKVEKKVIKTVWNVLLNRYDSIELGDNKSDFTKTFNDNIGDISSIVKQNTQIISVVQNVNREVGSITSTVSKVEEDITGIQTSITEIKQTTEEISLEVTQLGNKRVTKIQQYYLQNDGEEPSEDDENWNIKPTWENGKHTWLMLVTTYEDKTEEKSIPVDITSSTGKTITSVRTQYTLSTSKDVPEVNLVYPKDTLYPAENLFPLEAIETKWDYVMPELVVGYYLWSRQEITYNDGSIEYAFEVVVDALSELSTISSNLQVYADSIQSEVVMNRSDIFANQTGIESLRTSIEQTTTAITATVEENRRDIDANATTVANLQNDVEENSEKIVGLNTKIEQTATSITNTVNERVSGVESYVEMASTMLDRDGFHIKTADSENENTLDGDGMIITDKNGNIILSASTSEGGVHAENMTVENYFIHEFGDYRLRWEPYSDSRDSQQMGLFFESD